MKPNQVSSSGSMAIIRASLISLFLIYSTTLMSQTQINFTGTWTYDKTKSTADTYISDYPGTITREITQTASTLTYHDIYAQNENNTYKKSDIVLNLDGTEEIDKSDPDFTLSKSLKWLQGNKSFIITSKSKYTDDGVSREILITETYSLSDDGKTLTIAEFHKAELGEKKSTNIYNKK
jgi:hypothetical protein